MGRKKTRTMFSSKKAISEVIATLLLVALTMIAVGIIWAAVNTFVKTSVSSTKACYGLNDKVTLNNLYTCYNGTYSPKELWFAVDVGDVDNVQDILVSITWQGNSTSFRINQNNATSGLLYFNRTGPVTIPGKNRGITYIYPLPSYFTDVPDSIEIAPIVDNQLCSSVDSIEQIDNCAALSGF